MEATSRPEMPAKRKNRKKGTSAFCYRFHNGRFYEWSHADVHGDPHPATRCFRFFPCPFSFFFIFFFLLFFVVLPKSGRAEDRHRKQSNWAASARSFPSSPSSRHYQTIVKEINYREALNNRFQFDCRRFSNQFKKVLGNVTSNFGISKKKLIPKDPMKVS